MLLIKQYRHPMRARDWELPAGLLDIAGESPLAAAQRELAEEADLVAERWDLLGRVHDLARRQQRGRSASTSRAGVSAAPEVFERTDEEADIELRWVPLDDARRRRACARRAELDPRDRRAQRRTPVAHGAGRRSATADAPWPRHPLERATR